MTNAYSNARRHFRPRPKPRQRISTAIAALLSTLIVALGVAAEPAPAEAAATVGVGGYWTPAGGWLGNYTAGGQYVYCIDVLTDTAGSGGAGQLSDRIDDAGHGTRPVTGDELRKINYAVSVWGQTTDTVTAAAVAAYVYNFTSANWHGRGEHYIGGPYAAAILAKYQQIAADVEAGYRRSDGSGGGQLQLEIDPTNHYLGTLNVTGLAPSNAVGTVTLENGVFADTGLPTKDGVANNSSYPIIGMPPEGAVNYRITAAASFRGNGAPVYEPSVTIYAEGSDQRTVGPGTSRQSVVNFDLAAEDAHDRTTIFQPVVGTRVASTHVEEGDEFVDLLTFSTAADEGGLHNPWRRSDADGYVPVVATGTLYGPFLAQPLESDSVPENAPVAASDVVLTTSPEQGPEIEYEARSGLVAEEAGFYTWVWTIDSGGQSPETQQFLPESYRFADRFGQVVETSISPTKLAISTLLSRSVAGAGQLVTDEVSVYPHGGGWLQADGARVPAILTGTAYFSETEPTLADAAPDGAEVVATMQLAIGGPGSATSDPIRLPLRDGYVTVQWCLREAEQPEQYRGLLAEACDSYGQASETVQVRVPEVTTEATPLALPGGLISDTAIVTGEVADGMHLEFSVYKQPVAGDMKRSERSDEGEPADEIGQEGADVARWTRDEVDRLAGQPLCTEENLLDSSAPVPVESGENNGTRYGSPEVRVDSVGTYWWVERLVRTDPESGDRTVVHEGVCGLPNETSTVKLPDPPTPPTEKLAVTGAGSGRDSTIDFTAALVLGLGVVVTALGVARTIRR